MAMMNRRDCMFLPLSRPLDGASLDLALRMTARAELTFLFYSGHICVTVDDIAAACERWGS